MVSLKKKAGVRHPRCLGCQPKDWIVVTYNLKTGTILMCYFYMYSHINITEVS